ncbi:MAG: hypothetical protein JST39_19740 [Bacteroidetes bacterium]|nr:hypothetical protein [Bacteroidota bacterium]
MGRIKKGILGGFSGTVGTVAGGNWKGIAYMRSLPEVSQSDPSPAQIAHRSKFGMVVNFLKAFNGLLEFSFQDDAVQQTGFNAAVSQIFKSAITGAYPAYQISYPQVLVSRGGLPNVGAPSAAAGAAGKIVWHWTDNTGLGKASASDKAVLVTYCESLGISAFTIAPDLRSSGTATLNVVGFGGQPVHTWLAFTSDDKSEVATSIYTGLVNVV